MKKVLSSFLRTITSKVVLLAFLFIIINATAWSQKKQLVPSTKITRIGWIDPVALRNGFVEYKIETVSWQPIKTIKRPGASADFQRIQQKRNERRIAANNEYERRVVIASRVMSTPLSMKVFRLIRIHQDLISAFFPG